MGIGKTGVGEMGLGEMGTPRVMHVPVPFILC